MDKLPKNNVYAFYVVLTIALIYLGYRHGNKTNNGIEHGIYGGFIGLIISYILWETWGKHNTY